MLPPLISGGGQERRRRAGTENVAAIAGFGAAAEAARRDLAQMKHVQALRDQLEAQMRAITPEAVVIAESAPRLPNTTSLALPGASAETLVIALDLAGIAVSAGAACSSGKVGTSHVLAAMGLAPHVARGAIRISLGHASTERDVASFLAAWSHIAAGRRERAVA
jgi:cysteine desulfurase